MGKKKEMREWDTQVGGEHYQKLAIQPTDYIYLNGLDFVQGNIVKYVSRFRDKNGMQDLEKALHYLNYLIEQEKIKGTK